MHPIVIAALYNKIATGPASIKRIVNNLVAWKDTAGKIMNTMFLMLLSLTLLGRISVEY